MEPLKNQNPSTLQSLPPLQPQEDRTLNWGQRVLRLGLALLGTITLIPLIFKGKAICSLYKEFAKGQKASAEKAETVAEKTLPSPIPNLRKTAQNTQVRKILIDQLKKLVHEEGAPSSLQPLQDLLKEGKELEALKWMRDQFESPHYATKAPFSKKLNTFIAYAFDKPLIGSDLIDTSTAASIERSSEVLAKTTNRNTQISDDEKKATMEAIEDLQQAGENFIEPEA